MKPNWGVRWIAVNVATLLLWSNAWAADGEAEKPGKREGAKAAAAAPRPRPTQANVAYGPHPKQMLDFWKAESTGPTPLVFFIHGGAWLAGDKSSVRNLREYLPAGISVVSIEYRFVSEAQAAEVRPPVAWPMHDAARALQFVRSKAREWNLDPKRIGASGGSAGACSSLWLAFHDDMADPKSDDPVARQSTRLWCAGVTGAQTTLDPKQMKEWIPNSRYGGHAFGFRGQPSRGISPFERFLAGRKKVLTWLKEYSPYELVSADDPPICLSYSTPPAMGQEQEDPTHSANFGVGLQEKLRSFGVECHLIYPGAAEAQYASVTQFLIAKLKSP